MSPHPLPPILLSSFSWLYGYALVYCASISTFSQSCSIILSGAGCCVVHGPDDLNCAFIDILHAVVLWKVGRFSQATGTSGFVSFVRVRHAMSPPKATHHHHASPLRGCCRLHFAEPLTLEEPSRRKACLMHFCWLAGLADVSMCKLSCDCSSMISLS